MAHGNLAGAVLVLAQKVRGTLQHLTGHSFGIMKSTAELAPNWRRGGDLLELGAGPFLSKRKQNMSIMIYDLVKIRTATALFEQNLCHVASSMRPAKC